MIVSKVWNLRRSVSESTNYGHTMRYVTYVYRYLSRVRCRIEIHNMLDRKRRMRYHIERVRYTDRLKRQMRDVNSATKQKCTPERTGAGGEGTKLERRRWVKKYTNRMESIIRDRVKRRKQVVLKGGYPP